MKFTHLYDFRDGLAQAVTIQSAESIPDGRAVERGYHELLVAAVGRRVITGDPKTEYQLIGEQTPCPSDPWRMTNASFAAL